MSLDYAEIGGLPTSTIEHRQLDYFVQVKDFFNFIQAIEANFVENLTVGMMIAYDNGFLIGVISSVLKENNATYSYFISLSDDIDE